MAIINGFVFFCEDVREETGGKSSYMGVFGPVIEIPIPANFPAGTQPVLGKLHICFLVNIDGLNQVDFKAEVSSNISLPNPLPSPLIQNVLKPVQNNLPWQIKTQAIIGPLIIPQEVEISARLTVGKHKSISKLIIKPGKF